MGTNYYWKVGACPTCGHTDKKYHVGKSSGGWEFTFQALQEYESPTGAPITSANDWRHVLKGAGSLVDEYGESITPEDFWKMVDRKKGGKNHTVEYARDYGGGGSSTWRDVEGNAFVKGYFS